MMLEIYPCIYEQLTYSSQKRQVYSHPRLAFSEAKGMIVVHAASNAFRSGSPTHFLIESQHACMHAVDHTARQNPVLGSQASSQITPATTQVTLTTGLAIREQAGGVCVLKK